MIIAVSFEVRCCKVEAEGRSAGEVTSCSQVSASRFKEYLLSIELFRVVMEEKKRFWSADDKAVEVVAEYICWSAGILIAYLRLCERRKTCVRGSERRIESARPGDSVRDKFSDIVLHCQQMRCLVCEKS